MADNNERTTGVFDVDPRELILGIRRKRWLILASTLAVGAAVTAGTLRLPKIYRGVAQITIEPVMPKVLGDGVAVDDLTEQARQERVFVNTQYMTITSRAVIQDVAARLRLHQDKAYLETYELSGLEGTALDRAIEATLIEQITVEPERSSRIVNLVVEDQDGKRAAKIAETLGQAYIDYSLDRRLDTTRSASNWLDERVVEFARKLEGAERALYDFKRSNTLVSVSLEDRQNMTAASMSLLNQKLLETRTHLIELQAKKRVLDTQLAAGRPEAVPQLAQNPVISELRSTVVVLAKQRAELSTRYGEKHPNMVSIEKQLAETTEQLQREIDFGVQALDNEIASLENAEAAMSEAMAAEKESAMALNSLALDYSKLTRDLGTTGTMYQALLKRQTEADLSGLLKSNFVHWFQKPEARLSPIRPSVPKNAAAGLAIGLALGLLMALASVLLDNTVHSPADVENFFGLPFLGVFPKIDEQKERRAGAKGAVVAIDRDKYILQNPKSAVAECARAVRTNLMFMGADKPLRRLLLTSARPAEGKTTTAIALGITMAQAGNRVLLVDTDLRKPRLHRAFGVSGEHGLTSVLAEMTSLSEAIKSTEVVGLHLLPCGPVPPNPAELLHSERFLALLEELSARFDRVLFDSPPVGAVTDAAILSKRVDGTILVIQANRTPREAVRRSARQLRDVNAKVVGVVLNDFGIDDGTYGYNQYYYHRYGYEAEDEAKA